jgi:hypothetical protein
MKEPPEGRWIPEGSKEFPSTSYIHTTAGAMLLLETGLCIHSYSIQHPGPYFIPGR